MQRAIIATTLLLALFYPSLKAHPANPDANGPLSHPQTAIIKGDYKLLYWWDTKESFLYEIVPDYRENKNLVNEKPELAAQLLSELQAHAKAGLDTETFASLERGEVKSGRRPGGGNRGERRNRGDRQNRENSQNQRP